MTPRVERVRKNAQWEWEFLTNPSSEYLGNAGHSLHYEAIIFGELITLGACSLQPVITRHDWDAWCPLNRGEQRGSGHSCGFHTRGIQHRLSAKELDKYTLV